MSPPRIIRPIKLCFDRAEIPLTRSMTAIIDLADVHLVEHLSWHAIPGRVSHYASASIPASMGGKRNVLLHRFLLSAPAGMEVDHLDGDGLNCRRGNLRVATTAQNQQNRRISADNTSGLKGASFDRTKKQWQAQIRINGRQTKIGHFNSAEEAHEAYVQTALRHFGEFARAR